MKTKIFTIMFILLTLGIFGIAVGQDEENELIRMDTSAFDTMKRPAAVLTTIHTMRRPGWKTARGVTTYGRTAGL